nr:MAG TPA: hypothetical protein [Caudoviricetes sp.]
MLTTRIVSYYSSNHWPGSSRSKLKTEESRYGYQS